MHQPVDPRDVITPESFSIHPALIGLPLARPWRRALAILLDLLLVGLFVAAGRVFFAAAAAFTLFTASARRGGGGFLRRATRYTLRFAGAIALFITIVVTWNAITNRGREPPPSGWREPAGFIRDYARLRSSMTDEEAVLVAERLVERLARTQPQAIAELAGELDQETGDFAGLPPHALHALRSALASRAETMAAETRADDGAAAEPVDSFALLATAYSDALRVGDSAAAAELRPRVEAHAAAPQLQAAEARRHELAQRTEQLSEELRTARSRSGRIRAFLSRTANDLGLGFGWMGLYFTAFTVLMRGQTPGKRLLRIRVLRLDGERIGWWSAFGRFGGYSASLATGLLGFAQVIWDRNRQTLQDKLADTVVVFTPKRGDASPPPPRS